MNKVEAESLVEGSVVFIQKDIVCGGGDHFPASMLAYKGDKCVVIKVSHNPTQVAVKHYDYKGDGGIMAYPHELSLKTPLLTIAERRQYVGRFSLERAGFTEKDLHIINIKEDE